MEKMYIRLGIYFYQIIGKNITLSFYQVITLSKFPHPRESRFNHTLSEYLKFY